MCCNGEQRDYSAFAVTFYKNAAVQRFGPAVHCNSGGGGPFEPVCNRAGPGLGNRLEGPGLTFPPLPQKRAVNRICQIYV